MQHYLVYSDSHGDSGAVYSIIEAHKTILSGVLFLGDGATEAIEMAHNYSDIPFYAVTGNNDFGAQSSQRITFPLERVECFNGLTIYMTHGHLTSYNRVKEVVSKNAKDHGAKLAFYGHLHVHYRAIHNDVLTINPGSVSLPRGQSVASYAILTIKGRDDFSIQFYRAETHQPLEI